jgi:glucose-6-phosphate 1-dehydrogenase
MTALSAEWAENETYRIDHYLGKEMIKNMLVLRFGNVFLDASLNRNFVSNTRRSEQSSSPDMTRDPFRMAFR